MRTPISVNQIGAVRTHELYDLVTICFIPSYIPGYQHYQEDRYREMTYGQFLSYVPNKCKTGHWRKKIYSGKTIHFYTKTKSHA